MVLDEFGHSTTHDVSLCGASNRGRHVLPYHSTAKRTAITRCLHDNDSNYKKVDTREGNQYYRIYAGMVGLITILDHCTISHGDCRWY